MAGTDKFMIHERKKHRMVTFVFYTYVMNEKIRKSEG